MVKFGERCRMIEEEQGIGWERFGIRIRTSQNTMRQIKNTFFSKRFVHKQIVSLRNRGSIAFNRSLTSLGHL